MRIDHAILRKIQFIEDSKAGIDYENIQVVKYPERKYIPIGAEEELLQANHSTFIQPLYFMGKIARNLERFLQMPFQRKMRRYARFLQEPMLWGITKGHMKRFRTALKG